MALDPKRQDHYPAAAVAAAQALAARAPVPAQVGNVLFGSCSWTDPTLVKSGLFYPRAANTAEKRLRYYASRFPLVEVDSSYYALPSTAQARSWVERTPADFRFDIKVFSAMTGHSVELAALPKDLKAALPPALLRRRRARPSELPPPVLEACWERFVAAIEPLRSAKKLGAVLLQYPPWFKATRGNARTLVEARRKLGELPLAVEFRHRSWLKPSRRDRVMDLLRDQGMTYVAVDAPQGTDTGLPPWLEVTQPRLVMIRFHGRNQRTWSAPLSTAAERFDHLYSEEELAPWIERLRRASQQAEEVHALMNNCTYNAAQLGACDLAALLEDARGSSLQAGRGDLVRSGSPGGPC